MVRTLFLLFIGIISSLPLLAGQIAAAGVDREFFGDCGETLGPIWAYETSLITDRHRLKTWTCPDCLPVELMGKSVLRSAGGKKIEFDHSIVLPADALKNHIPKATNTGSPLKFELEFQPLIRKVRTTQIESLDLLYTISESAEQTVIQYFDTNHWNQYRVKISQSFQHGLSGARKNLTGWQWIPEFVKVAKNDSRVENSAKPSIAPRDDDYWQYYADCDHWGVVFTPLSVQTNRIFKVEPVDDISPGRSSDSWISGVWNWSQFELSSHFGDVSNRLEQFATNFRADARSACLPDLTKIRDRLIRSIYQ